MAYHGENHVISGPGIILWDGVTRPEMKDGKDGAKVPQFSLKVAFVQTSPELQEVSAICMKALQNDQKFRGQLPPGGCWPIMPVDPTQFDGRLPHHQAFSAKSGRAPQVFDANGRELSAMEYGPLLYAGATVKVLVHAYSFDNKSKGVALGLDGIQIVDATTPRLPVGGVDAGAAFGATQPPAGGYQPPAPPAGGYQPPAPPAGGYQPPAPPAGGYQPPAPPAGGYQPPAPPAGGYQPPAPPAGGYQPPAPPAGSVTPAPDFLNPQGGVPGAPPAGGYQPPAPPAKRMVTAPGGVQYEYDLLIGQGWTDQTLAAHGYTL